MKWLEFRQSGVAVNFAEVLLNTLVQVVEISDFTRERCTDYAQAGL